MTDKTTALIEVAVNDKTAADGARADVAKQQQVVHDADDKLAADNQIALDAHEKALTSSHAAIEALMGELEQEPVPTK